VRISTGVHDSFWKRLEMRMEYYGHGRPKGHSPIFNCLEISRNTTVKASQAELPLLALLNDMSAVISPHHVNNNDC
jgi:hypothetical protein